MSQVKYKETQRFSKLDVFVLLGLFIAVGAFRLSQELFSANPDGTRVGILVAGVLLFGGLMYYLTQLRLTARFNEKNLKFKVSPFGLRKGKIKWSEVIRAEIIEMPPAFIWSGWNVHFTSLHKLINLNGRTILHLTLKTGEEISIGCKSRDQLESFFNEARELHPNLRDISLV